MNKLKFKITYDAKYENFCIRQRVGDFPFYVWRWLGSVATKQDAEDKIKYLQSLDVELE
jgi:hypothetical protein